MPDTTIVISRAQHKKIGDLMDKHKCSVYTIESTNVKQAIAIHLKSRTYLISINGIEMGL